MALLQRFSLEARAGRNGGKEVAIIATKPKYLKVVDPFHSTPMDIFYKFRQTDKTFDDHCWQTSCELDWNALYTLTYKPITFEIGLCWVTSEVLKRTCIFHMPGGYEMRLASSYIFSRVTFQGSRSRLNMEPVQTCFVHFKPLIVGSVNALMDNLCIILPRKKCFFTCC